jgi:RimJ/RimL family protein N-acetyltransferase
MSLPTLHTPRLLLRPLQLEDAGAIQRIFPRWEIVRYMAAHIPWPYPEDGARRFLQDIALPTMARGIEWHWSLRLRSDPEVLIGVISLHDEPIIIGVSGFLRLFGARDSCVRPARR